MRRTLLILGPVVGVILVLMLALQVARPFLERWALRNLTSFSNAELPLTITAEQFHLDFMLPKAELVGVQVNLKPELGMGDMQIDADRVVAKLDFLQLLAGHLQLSSIVIEGLATDVDLDPFLKDKRKPQPIDWNPVFQALRKIPITRVALQGASVQLHAASIKFEADLDEFDMLLVNEHERLHARFDLQDSELTWADLSSPVRIQTEAILTQQGLDISDVRVLGLGSLLRGSASFTRLPYLLIEPEGSMQFEMKASLPQVAKLLQQMRKVPDMQGTLDLKGNLQLEHGAFSGGGFRIFGQNLAFGKFQIGQVDTEGRLFDGLLQVPHVALTHAAGLADITGLQVQFDRDGTELKQATMKGRLETDSLDIHDLLLGLGIGDLPIELFLTGDLKCEGPLWPDFKLGCGGKITGEEMEVRVGDHGKKVLISAPRMDAEGNVTIDTEKVQYDARLKMEQDEGKSSGTIVYDHGFDIDYSTPHLNFSNFHERIADLKLQGSARLEGKTTGNSSSGRFQMEIQAQDLAFEDFILGQPHGTLRYEKGSLYFDNIQASLGASLYRGNLSVDLINERLRADFQSDALELADLTHMFERRLKIPVEITGSGSARGTVSGPLQINHLTYQGQAQFHRVSAAGENFDRVDLTAHSDDGEFRVDKAIAAKGKNLIELTGQGHPSGQIEFLVVGKELPLEQSENISALSSNISGLLNFSLKITDQIRAPQLELNARASNIVIEEQEMPNVEADTKMTTQEMSGSVKLADGKLQSSFLLPFDTNRPFSLQARANDWNYTTVFALLGAGQLLSEYQASITGVLDLKADEGGFWKSTGKGRIERAFLKRGSLSLENSGPMELTFHNGAFSFQNFKLKGPDAFIELQGEHNTRENLAMRVSTQAELRLMQIFLPFLEEFSGRAKAEMTLAGPLEKPDLLGSARTENAFVKAKGFPHPFEKIAADVQFSQSRVVINSARGELGGGTFSGDGSISINGIRDLPTQIHIRLSNATLNVPDHVRTTGSGEFDLTGNWFPFTLSGAYHVQSGLFDKELSADENQNAVKKSSYLPKMILQKAFEPLLLDLQVILDQPLQVKNSMIDGLVTGSLQVKGPPSAPILFGQINTEKGAKISFRTNTFDIVTANVKFNDPKEINPELYASARARVAEYDVNLVVQGTAKSPIIHTSSVPPLSEQDIVSLLALGVTTEKTDRRLQSGTQNGQESDSGTYQIGTAVLQQIPLFQQAQKATGFNVQFSSNYNDTKNVETKIITVSRQVSEKVKASAARLVGDQTSNEFKIEYSLNPSVSAIGTYQQIESSERTTLQNTQNESESIFGLDLEFRKEFR